MSREQTGLVHVQDPMPSQAELSVLRAFADEIAKASFMCPDAMRGQPGDILLALLIARQARLPPVFVLQNIHVIKGKAVLSAQFMIALANGSGRFRGPIRYKVENEGTPELAVTAWAMLAEDGERVEYRVPLSMAKAEGWVERNPKYRTMPAHMLRFRAATFLVRFYAPDVLLGFHEEDEIRDSGPVIEGSSSTAPTTPVPSSLSKTDSRAQVVDAVELTPDPDQEERDQLIMDIKRMGVVVSTDRKTEARLEAGVEKINGSTPIEKLRKLHEIMERLYDEATKPTTPTPERVEHQVPAGEELEDDKSGKLEDEDEDLGGGEEKLEQVDIPKAPVTTPPPPAEPTEPKKVDLAHQQASDLALVQSVALKLNVGDKRDDTEFRRICRQTLGLSRIPEERYQAVLRGGEKANSWHLTIEGPNKKLWVNMGPKPANSKARAAEPNPAEPAGDDLEMQCADFEVDLQGLMEAAETPARDIQRTFKTLRERAGVTPDDLAAQPRDKVLYYKNTLQQKCKELR